MSNLADLNPDMALASLLDGKVAIDYGTKGGVEQLRCYAAGRQPSKGLARSFISIEWNGAAKSLTQPLGLFSGNLMLIISCELLNSTIDGQTVNTSRVRKVLAQVVERVNGKTADGYHFTFDPSQVITPTTPNLTTGYSTTRLNVKWHVTDEFLRESEAINR